MGNDKFRLIPWQEMRWQHTDYRVTLAVELDNAARNIGFTSETSLPKLVTEDGHTVVAGRVLLWQERAAIYRMASQDPKEIISDDCAL